MMKNLATVLACLIVTAAVSAQPPDPLLRHIVLEGTDVTLSLARRSAVRQPVPWPAADVRLQVEPVKAGDSTIQELLAARHIHPDVEAFALVYALNPDVGDLAELDAARALRLPRVAGAAPLLALLESDMVVLVTIDRAAKEAFVESVRQLEAATAALRKQGDAAYGSAELRQTVEPNVDWTIDRLGRIAARIRERSGRPIPEDVLSHLRADAGLLREIVSAAVSRTTRIGKKQQQDIEEIRKNVGLKAATFSVVAAGAAPKRWPTVKVTVQTLLRNGRRAALYRIYYVPIELRNDPRSYRAFKKLSTATAATAAYLTEAHYCFWGGKDPSNKPLTNIFCDSILVGQPADIDLTVIPAATKSGKKKK